MKKSLVALAFGTLALGIAEFVMMGILPNVSRYFDVSIPTAGHCISAYALGVCCGAPLLVAFHKYPLKRLLLFLAGLILFGAALSAMAQSFVMLVVARFISGLPHGAYFGVASIVAVKLADEAHKTSAVSIMVAGMTVANLFGVPLATALSSHISWRFPFMLLIFISIIVIYYVWKWIPASVGALPDEGFRHQFAFLRHGAPWLILAATMLGNGGIFCWYSYVSPLLTSVGGFPHEALSALMIAAGFGMVAGNLISGRLCDRHRPGHVAAVTQTITIATLLLIFLLAGYGWISAALMVVCTGCLFAMSSPQQFLILKHAPGGELLGGAAIQVAFNLGNAIGAFCGGLPMEHGATPRWSALVGVPFVVMGLVAFICFCRKYERRSAAVD